MAFETPLGTILLLLVALLAVLSCAYGFLSMRKRKRDLEELRRQRYQSIKRDGQ